MEAVRDQARQVREALLEVRETTADPVVRVEGPVFGCGDWILLLRICTAVWYEVSGRSSM